MEQSNTAIDEQTSSGRYIYPVTPDDPEWKNFTSNIQMIEACEIPWDILDEMSTVDVIDSAVHHPMIASIFAMSDGVDVYKDELNVLAVMYSREDLDENLQYYKENIEKYIPEDEPDRDFLISAFDALKNYYDDSGKHVEVHYGMSYSDNYNEIIDKYERMGLADFEGSDTKVVCTDGDDEYPKLILDYSDHSFLFDAGEFGESISGSFEIKDEYLMCKPDGDDPEKVIGFDIKWALLDYDLDNSGMVSLDAIKKAAAAYNLEYESFDYFSLGRNSDQTYRANYGEPEWVETKKNALQHP